MSRQNVDIIRAVIDAFNRGDWDAALKQAAPDFELDNSRDLGEWRGVHTTPDQAKRVMERFTEAWESVSIEVDEFIEAGDRVVTRQTATLRGREGIEVNARANWLWRFRGGAVTHLVSYPELNDALDAAGLTG